MTCEVLAIFSSFQDYLKEEQKMRDEISNIVKVLELTAHELVTVMQAIHQDGSDSGIKACCERARELIERDVRVEYKNLNEVLKKLPSNQYYKFHDQWRFVTQRLSFIVSLVFYLESGTFATQEDVAKLLDVEQVRGENFHLDVVDYLMGVLQLVTELARFAVNSVIQGDYKRPSHISKFVMELNAGFTLLSLKNDTLRKRFDRLKYDIKKIEEVVYDLSIRGLTKEESKQEEKK